MPAPLHGGGIKIISPTHTLKRSILKKDEIIIFSLVCTFFHRKIRRTFNYFGMALQSEVYKKNPPKESSCIVISVEIVYVSIQFG